MKIKFFFLALLAITALNSCKNGEPCIKGEGAAVTETWELPPIDGFSLCIDAKVNLTYGETQSVTVTGQQNILDELTRDVSGTTWTIGLDRCTWKHDKLTIDITMPNLALVDISGSGDVRTTNTFIEQEDLSIEISGSGDVALDFEGRDISSRISGSGDIDLFGSANKISQKVSGSGSLEAFDMPCTEATVKISGSGSSELTVSDDLEVDISGSGDVYYKGNPILDVNVSGSGDVVNAN